jgi:hypothetical protein
MWTATTFYGFYVHLIHVLLDGAALHMKDMIKITLNSTGIKPQDMQDVFNEHMNEIADELKVSLGLQRPGRPSQWGKYEFLRAVTGALRTLPPKKQTYAGVAAALRKSHPTKAPKSGDVVRKTLDRFDFDWKEIKNEVNDKDYLINKTSRYRMASTEISGKWN